MPEPYVIGFDVGGTRLKSGVVTRSGKLTKSGSTPSGYTMQPEEFMAAVFQVVKRIRHAHGHSPACIGMGLPGAVDPDRGIVLLPGKLKLEHYPVVPRLRHALGIPVTADNDARLAILAETLFGKARNRRWAVSVTIGTGVGSGVLLDGRILRDARLQFGTQASHIMQQSASDRLCITGGRGTPNILCSATALAITVRDGLMRGLPSVLQPRFQKDPHTIDFRAVIWGVEQDDRLCRDALARWIRHLSGFLVNVVYMYAPEIIILGGGAMAAADYFLPQVQAHVTKNAYRYPPDDPIPVVLSDMADYAGIYGAAALAWDYLDRQHLLEQS